MIQFLNKTYVTLMSVFFTIYPFFIYPWGNSYYYANAKAYYFIGFIFLLSLLFLSKVWLEKKKFMLKWSIIDGLMVAFLLLLVLSTVTSSHISWIGIGTEHQGIIMMLSYIILFYLISRLQKDQFRTLCQFIIISSVIASLYSILQFYHLTFLPQDKLYRFYFGERTYSFFDNPDYFGSYLVLVIPLTITYFLLSKGKKEQLFYFGILCLQLFSLIESQTRSAWMGTVVSFCFIIFWMMRKNRRLLIRWTLIVAACFLIFTYSNSTTHQEVLSRTVTITQDVQKIIKNNNADSAGASRWYIWKASLPIIAKHFWLGTGPNTFEQVFYSNTNQNLNQIYLGGNTVYDENNDYLQIALTMGVPALLVYILILFIIVFKSFKSARRMDLHQQLFTYGLLAAVIGFLVQAFFNINVASVGPYFWLLLGGLWGQTAEKQIEK